MRYRRLEQVLLERQQHDAVILILTTHLSTSNLPAPPPHPAFLSCVPQRISSSSRTPHRVDNDRSHPNRRQPQNSPRRDDRARRVRLATLTAGERRSCASTADIAEPGRTIACCRRRKTRCRSPIPFSRSSRRSASRWKTSSTSRSASRVSRVSAATASSSAAASRW